MTSLPRNVLWIAFAALLPACASGGGDCVPGIIQACRCEGGQSGVAECQPNRELGSCFCGSDAGPARDAAVRDALVLDAAAMDLGSMDAAAIDAEDLDALDLDAVDFDAEVADTASVGADAGELDAEGTDTGTVSGG